MVQDDLPRWENWPGIIMVKFNKTLWNTTNQRVHWDPKATSFPPGGRDSSFPCETFCWACLETFTLHLKLKSISNNSWVSSVLHFPMENSMPHSWPCAAGSWGISVLTFVPKLWPQAFKWLLQERTNPGEKIKKKEKSKFFSKCWPCPPTFKFFPFVVGVFLPFSTILPLKHHKQRFSR